MSGKRRHCYCDQRLTRSHALQVLFRHAARDVAGTGCGLRNPITEDDRAHVAFVIKHLWPLAHPHSPFTETVLFNMGIL